MRRVAKISAIAIGAVVLLFGVGFALIESGEVIVLRGLSGEGHDFIARLWVVDYDGDPWVGKADPSKAKWVFRLRSNPRVELSRGDVTDCREAIPLEDRQTRREIYAYYQSKYRIPLYGSRLLGLLFGSTPDPAEAEQSGVLFRLLPCDTAP
jgi:hypothetical protein